jgi:hypothetical protein
MAKSVQLRLVRQRVAMAAQKAQADVLINRLHYALPGWDGAKGRRDAQEASYELRKRSGAAAGVAADDRVEFAHLDFDDADVGEGHLSPESLKARGHLL